MFVRRIFFAFFALFLLCSNIIAVPARRNVRCVQQKDGTMLTLYLFGDEHFHCYVTSDSLPVVENGGVFYYADVSERNIIATDIVAHDKAMRSRVEREFCMKHGNDIWNRISDVWAEKRNSIAPARQKKIKSARKDGAFLGKKKGLVLLVNFSNLSMKGSNPRSEFDMQFNQINYSNNNHIGSVSDYFFDQSYGAFELMFDVVGPLTVSNDYAYYGNNRAMTDSDSHPATMVAEACRLADKSVNFSDYDWNGDGEVEQVFVVYAGYGEASGAPSNTIWPHQSSLSGHAYYYGDGPGALVLDGVKVDVYACSSELSGTFGSVMDGIGTACHEFSHCLGLPDLYDTNYKGGVGMSCWDVMCNGAHSGPNQIGEIPCGYSAFERYLLGWLELNRLSSAQVIENMPSLGDSAVAYAFYNERDENEFFVIENRQNYGWFSYVGATNNAHGMLITHIDYDASVWVSNQVNNNRKHQRMSYVAADNSYGFYYDTGASAGYIVNASELEGDLFPGSKNVVSFTGNSHVDVGGIYFNASSNGEYIIQTPIENIEENDGCISFWFNGGRYIPSPILLEPTNVTENSFIANWATVDEAENYNIELTNVFRQEIAKQNMKLNEDFAKFKIADINNIIYDLGKMLDSYTIVPGWNGHKVYASADGAMIDGGIITPGYLITPFIAINDKCLTLKLSAKALGNSIANLRLTLMTKASEEVVEEEFSLSDSLEVKHIVVNKAFEDTLCCVKISSPDGVYINSFAVYDGVYSEWDLDMTKILTQKRYRKVLENLAETSCAFGNLDTTTYKYRVQAVAGSFISEWSNYRYVSLCNTLGVEDICDEDESGEYVYYSLSGRKMNGNILSGIYIRKGNGRSEKILIK